MRRGTGKPSRSAGIAAQCGEHVIILVETGTFSCFLHATHMVLRPRPFGADARTDFNVHACTQSKRAPPNAHFRDNSKHRMRCVAVWRSHCNAGTRPAHTQTLSPKSVALCGAWARRVDVQSTTVALWLSLACAPPPVSCDAGLPQAAARRARCGCLA